MDRMPAWGCELFRVESGVVRWITEGERAEALDRLAGTMPKRDLFRFRNKMIPFGCPAGGRDVHGRGRLIGLSGLAFTTADVAAMLADGGRWPWEEGAPAARGVAGVEDVSRASVIHASVQADAGGLVWRVSPHSTIPAGSPVVGMELAGGRRCLMRGGVGYLTSDVAHLLATGRWPWQPEWD